MTTLSSHVSPYAGPAERLPADPPTEAACITCDAEWVPDGSSLECLACRCARGLLVSLDEDGRVRLVRDLEDDAAWHRRRLAGHMAACREVSDAG